MKLIRGIHNFSKDIQGCVLSIGNFDGVHRGHQVLLRKLKEEGEKRNSPVLVIIFEPQPLEILSKNKAPARLTRLREKLRYLKQCGVDYVLCIQFNNYFSKLTAQQFVNDILVKRLGIQLLIVGEDFRFGAGRQGNFLSLKKDSYIYGFEVTSTNTIFSNGIRISSTAIRQELAKDRLEKAENLLGHPFIISGRVVHGNELGRTIGFPTANISLKHYIPPVNGVYAVEVTVIGNGSFFGIANIGKRPTVSGISQKLEVHLFDVDIYLYGRYIDVVLRKKIRNERKFTSLNELKTQIVHDILIARKFFNDFKI